MKKSLQRFIAVGVMIMGSLVGFWMSNSSTGKRALAQAQNQNQSATSQMPLPPPSDMPLPPPDMMGLPPPELAMPSQDMNFPPPSGQMPSAMDGNMVPPDMPFPPDGSIPMEMGLQDPSLANDPLFEISNTEGFNYNPTGLRDPFFPTRTGREAVTPLPVKAPDELDYNPQDPLQAYSLIEYRLVGVLWDVREPRAMVQVPDGKIYTIRRKVRLGREGAVVAAIRESEIVVAEPNPDGSYVNATTRILPMRK